MLFSLDDDNQEVLPANISNVLSDVGLIDDPAIETDPESHIQAIFKRHNAGVEDAAQQVGSLLKAADNDNVKLKAAEMILKMHGYLKSDKDEKAATPTINITIVGNENRSLLNVLLPSQ